MSDYRQTPQKEVAKIPNGDLGFVGNGPSQTEVELDQLIEQIPAMAFAAVMDGFVSYVNRQWQDYTGLSIAESAGEGWRCSVHPEDLELFLHTWRVAFATGQAFEHEARLRRAADRTYRWCLIRAATVGNNGGRVSRWHCLALDIDDRKSAAKPPCGTDEWARKVGDAIPQQIWSGPGDGSLDYCNEQWRKYMGISLEEIKGDGWQRMLHPDDQERVINAWQASVLNGTPYEQEERHRAADGTYRWFLCRALPMRNSKGQIERWYGTNTDIEDRKQAELGLRRSEAYLSEAQRLSHTGSWAFTPGSDTAFYWSEEMYRIYGFDPNQGPPDNDAAWERFHPEDRGKMRDLASAVAAGCMNTDLEVEHRIVLPDGTVKYIRSTAHPIFDDGGTVVEVFGTAIDITEQAQNRVAIEKALEEIQALKDQLYKENLALRDEIDRASMFEEIVGTSKPLQTVLSRLAKVAPTDSTVLITGETGTGKELIARAVHKRSRRSERAFVSVNCAALAPSLISSELFGHEKGAFTGATQRRLGRFELAHGGTIFLDEVGDLLPDTQLALLRVLQEREFERVGGTQPIRVDVRVIGATNRDLNAAVALGTFRQDLFYRLNVFPIEVPPLRERKTDILMLVEYFVQRYADRAGKNIRSIDKNTLEVLQSYPWPGNIRELQNVIERSVILTTGDIFRVDEVWLSLETPPIQARVEAPTPRHPEDEPWDERGVIEAALAKSKGRVSGPTGAAATLGIPPSTLGHRIKALSINRQQFKFQGR